MSMSNDIIEPLNLNVKVPFSFRGEDIKLINEFEYRKDIYKRLTLFLETNEFEKLKPQQRNKFCQLQNEAYKAMVKAEANMITDETKYTN